VQFVAQTVGTIFLVRRMVKTYHATPLGQLGIAICGSDLAYKARGVALAICSFAQRPVPAMILGELYWLSLALMPTDIDEFASDDKREILPSPRTSAL
jgi:hypothetical protein